MPRIIAYIVVDGTARFLPARDVQHAEELSERMLVHAAAGTAWYEFYQNTITADLVELAKNAPADQIHDLAQKMDEEGLSEFEGISYGIALEDTELQQLLGDTEAVALVVENMIADGELSPAARDMPATQIVHDWLIPDIETVSITTVDGKQITGPIREHQIDGVNFVTVSDARHSMVIATDAQRQGWEPYTTHGWHIDLLSMRAA